ncbi:MAG: membrane integrity-associated transporter subunit PqiC [Desulfovibrio sp.]|nr:membrane integrity-associated transporter subunit PqiC [Desulfovibrio sp.]MBQ2476621.1 membrane integrity-associated transporter subunit PqiC [Desulfovibrio sp.]
MRIRALLPLAFSLALAACGQSMPTHYYILDSQVQPLAAESMPRTTLAVSTVTLPAYLDTKAVVLRGTNGAVLDVPQFNMWGEPLEEGIARVLRQRLAKPLLARGLTVLPSQDAHIASAYNLVVDIVRLEGDLAGRVLLEARWTLVDADASRVMARGGWTGEEGVQLPETIGQETFKAVVAAESRLLQGFGDYLAGRLAEAAPARP